MTWRTNLVTPLPEVMRTGRAIADTGGEGPSDLNAHSCDEQRDDACHRLARKHPGAHGKCTDEELGPSWCPGVVTCARKPPAPTSAGQAGGEAWNRVPCKTSDLELHDQDDDECYEPGAAAAPAPFGRDARPDVAWVLEHLKTRVPRSAASKHSRGLTDSQVVISIVLLCTALASVSEREEVVEAALKSEEGPAEPTEERKGRCVPSPAVGSEVLRCVLDYLQGLCTREALAVRGERLAVRALGLLKPLAQRAEVHVKDVLLMPSACCRGYEGEMEARASAILGLVSGRVACLAAAGCERPEAWRWLVTALRLATGITELDLNRSDFALEQHAAMTEALRSQPATQMPLVMWCPDVSLRFMCKLQELRICCASLEPEAAHHWAKTLRLLGHLRVLHLESNPLGDDSAAVLIEAVRDARKLRDLNMAKTGLSDTAAVALCPLIPRLERLDVHANRISDKGAAHIADALRSLPPRPQPATQLRTDFTGNDISDVGKDRLIRACALAPVETLSCAYSRPLPIFGDEDSALFEPLESFDRERMPSSSPSCQAARRLGVQPSSCH